MKVADLHFHSLHSDGKHSVSWLVERLELARSSGLELAVLTDHDQIEGFTEFSKLTQKWFRSICALELSCTFEDSRNKSRELHLLVYGLNPQDEDLQRRLAKFRVERENRFFKICKKFEEAGIHLDAEGWVRRHQGVLGRPHVADALVEAGYASSRTDAFDRFLKDDSPYYVAKWRFPLDEAVVFARRHGCKTSIAHPGQYGFQEDELRIFKDLGVDALEVYHPRHLKAQTRYYDQACRRFGFLRSGGSDFHSDETDRIEGYPSLGRTQYPIEEAKRFLGDLV